MKIKFSLFIIAAICFSGCSSIKQTIKEPNYRLELKKDDFVVSQQFEGNAHTVKILCIDWSHLFKKNTGQFEGENFNMPMFSIPIIGNPLMDLTSMYANYDLISNHPGYDVILYPQYSIKTRKPILGLGILLKITDANVKAKLGKLKEE